MPLRLRLLAAAHAAVLLAAGTALLAQPAAPDTTPTARASADVAPRPAAVLARAAAPAAGPEAPAAPPTAPQRAAAAPARPAAARVAPAPRTARLGVQERGAAALASLDYPWRSLGYAVEFRPSTGRTAGLADARTRTITVFVRPDHDELELRTTIAHELGHALDFGSGTDERRARYREIRGLAGDTAWYPCDRCEDSSSPAGDWAEVFAAVLLGPGDFRSRLAGPPTPEQVEQLRPLFAVPAAPAPAQPAPREEVRDEPEDDEDEDGLLPL